MTTPTLTLIGTNHADPKGPRRLWNALTQMQPAWATLETVDGFTSIIPPDSQKNILHALALIEPPLHSEFIQDILENVQKQGYEEAITTGYTALARVPYAAVDTRDFDPRCQRRFIHLVDAAYLTTVSQEAKMFGPLGLALKKAGLTKHEQHAVGRAYSAIVAGKDFDQNYFRIATEATEDLPIRDAHMEKGIRAMIKQHGPNGVHISGNGHLFGCYGESPNLYQRLSDLSPVRRKLCEFD